MKKITNPEGLHVYKKYANGNYTTPAGDEQEIWPTFSINI